MTVTRGFELIFKTSQFDTSFKNLGTTKNVSYTEP